MAITASSIQPNNTLEEFRIQFNRLVVDVEGVAAGNTFSQSIIFEGATADENDFREYIYTAGVTDDGIGDPLDEFISFQLKIIMQGTNCAEPPRIKDLRAIALVT